MYTYTEYGLWRPSIYNASTIKIDVVAINETCQYARKDWKFPANGNFEPPAKGVCSFSASK